MSPGLMLATAAPHRVSSDVHRREIDGRIAYVLETWFFDRAGDKDCVDEFLGWADDAEVNPYV